MEMLAFCCISDIYFFSNYYDLQSVHFEWFEFKAVEDGLAVPVSNLTLPLTVTLQYLG